MTTTGIGLTATAVSTNPIEGVSPPNSNAPHSSTRSAPAAAARSMSATEPTHTSTRIRAALLLIALDANVEPAAAVGHAAGHGGRVERGDDFAGRADGDQTGSLARQPLVDLHLH